MDYNLNKDSSVLIKDRNFMLSNMTKAFAFKQWYDSVDNVFKYTVLDKYLEYFSKDCYYGALKKAKKENLKEIVEKIYRRYMGTQPLIDSINKELDTREEQRILLENRKNNADILRKLVDSNLKEGLVSFSSRELDCLYYLIDSGTISSYSELLKYGISF